MTSSARIAYLNGDFLPIDQARISPLDRGFIFGDGVYEVIPVYSGVPFRLEEHLRRLTDSLDAIHIRQPLSDGDWQQLIKRLIERNGGGDQSLYLQITRGVAERDHAFPAATAPTVFAMSKPLPTPQQSPVKAITLEDVRWQWCHIKATALLANLLLRQQAIEAGCHEAILIRNGWLTEGAASNVFIVKAGKIKTPAKSQAILPGITRDVIVEIGQRHGLDIEETNISQQELLDADEIWITSSTKELAPVVELDGRAVGNGQPGPVCKQLQSLFDDFKMQLRHGKAH